LARSSGLLQGLNLVAQGVKGSFATSLGVGRPNVDTLLVEEMASLDGMTGDTWPDRVYAMEKLQKETRLEEKEAAF
jgi:Ca-activated chloride channel family protein